MLGQKYFEKRLGDIYQYSRIAYKSGDGRANEREYSWELCVDVCGNIIFVLSSNDLLQDVSNISKIDHFSGTSGDDIWDITCSDIHILSKEFGISQKPALFSLPNSIVLARRDQTESVINLAKAYFSNFDFFRVDCEQGFSININNKNLCFQTLGVSKKFIELIDVGRIPNAILSHVSIPVDKNDNISVIEEEARSISWFLSLLSLNSNFIPIIEYLSNNQILQYSIENTVKNLYCRSYIVDNFRIEEGIPKAFETCYENYKSWQAKIDINSLIGFLVEINQQKYIDLKLAAMLMAYEYLLLKYLLEKGMSQNKIGNNIQQKLRQVNHYLCFIPSEMMSDTLRDSVRNPLFHQGEIPLLKLTDKINLFKKYYDLLIRIILRILDYKGQYVSVVTHSPSQP